MKIEASLTHRVEIGWYYKTKERTVIFLTMSGSVLVYLGDQGNLAENHWPRQKEVFCVLC